MQPTMQFWALICLFAICIPFTSSTSGGALLLEEDTFCPNSLFPELKLLRHAAPWGNVSAGLFTKVPEAESLPACTQACCAAVRNCHVAFLHGTVCFLVKCRSASLCRPYLRPGTKFDASFMVIVRPVHKTSSEETQDWTTPTAAAWEEDEGMSSDDSKVGTNEFKNSTPSAIGSGSSRSCVYGIVVDCPTHEECVVLNTKRRNGVCRCVEGFTRDPVSQRCTGAKNATPSDEAPPKSAATSAPTTTTPYPLVVSAGDNHVLYLPENEVILSAYVFKEVKEGTQYQYQWTLVSHPEGEETGVMQDQNTNTLKLSKLRVGLYTFRVAVTGNSSYGESTVNVTVLPPKRKNKAPVAVIQPNNVTVKLPNKETVLDGSFSTDDDKIVRHHWDAVAIPIGYNARLNDTPTLQLNDLIPGFYRFKLTVTDSDGVSNSTYANVTVLKEVDYPPTANAGTQIVVYMPNNEVTLNGNLSTDDKGIKSWEWTKSPDTDKHVDMEGTTSPYLHLSNMEVGVYKFVLKVTDTADQTSQAEVHVFVKPASNRAPTANAGPDVKVSLPLERPVILNGSGSSDDTGIVAWHWKQIQGPKPSQIQDAKSQVAKASGLIPGEYLFQLNITDASNLTSSDNVTVTVIQKSNAAPKANAGGDRTIFLPADVVCLDGSGSTDEVEVVAWHWTREPSSLAAGRVLENSSYAATLRLTDLIPGRYMFTLTVWDAQGASGKDTTSLIVKPPTNLLDQVELLLNVDVQTFTQEQLDTVLKQLELLLHDGEPVRVQLINLAYQQDTMRVRIVFVTEGGTPFKRSKGTAVVSRLKQRLRTHSALLDWEVLRVDTLVCQNQCSSHGSCDVYTKQCICEAFWMEDLIRAYLGDRESNCDWSVLYVIIVSFLVLTVLSASLWGLACFCSQMKFHRPRKKNNYTLLRDPRDLEKDGVDLIPKGKTQTSSLMVSDSDSDTAFEMRGRPSVAVKPLSGARNGIPNGDHPSRRIRT